MQKNLKKPLKDKDPSSPVVMKKLYEHDKRFDEHDKRFDEHDKRFDAHDKRFDKIEQKLEEHDRKFEFLIEKFMDHENRLIRIEETMVTKKEFYELYNKIDSFLALYTKHDQEITIMGHQLHRHDQDIAQIKLAINLRNL